ncbi:MAG TPA: nucleotide exchange factor GrpE [Acidobacteriaceae bacterium]|jgi:molecular chaperone GrpE|nr:nucleotide exchange factor GrpE [Acidobacteriaceae bacterium]
MDEVNRDTATEAVISDSSEPPSVAALAEPAGALRDDAQPRVTGEQLASIGATLTAQSDLLKSSHNLLVDLAGKIGQMSDEAVERATRPIFIDLILLFDSLQQTRTWVSSSTRQSNEAFENRLSVLEAELLEILLRRDVQKLEETGTKLDRQRHRAVKTVATANPEEDNQIREVIRAGFAVGERVLRPADVVIGKFDATLKGEGE